MITGAGYGYGDSSTDQKIDKHQLGRMMQHDSASPLSQQKGSGQGSMYGTTETKLGEVVKDEHCHSVDEAAGIDKRARRKLIIASILCLLFMIGEIAGGAIANSLAIMTDAAHLLTDFASFMISLFAIYIASRPATKRMSFGWHRAEVVGALVSVLMIWVVTGILVYLAVQRTIHKNFEIGGMVMLITSAFGVAVNIVMAATLHQHSHSHGAHGHSHQATGLTPGTTPDTSVHNTPKHKVGGGHGHSHNGDSAHGHSHEGDSADAHGHAHDDGHAHMDLESADFEKKKTESENINVRAAFIHVIGDLVQSVGVCIAAMVIYFKPEYKLADPICTFIFSVLVLITTINILRDTMNVLMEGTPKGLNFNEVKAALYEIPGVVEVHNLRMWSLTINRNALSVHLAIDKNYDAQPILKRASRMLRRRFQISDVTVQLEDYVEDMKECQHCKDPSD